MSSRLIIALIIMLLAQGVQAHNFVTGKTVTPVYIQEGGELLLNSDDEIHYQKWNSTQLAGKVRIIQYIAGRKSAKKKNSLLIKAVEAANGTLALDVVLDIVFYKVLIALEMLLPVGLYVSVGVTLGQMYTDSEITAISAAGGSPGRLYKAVLYLAIPLSIFVTLLSMYGRPWAYAQIYQLEQQSQSELDVRQLRAKKFNTNDNGRMILSQTVDQDNNRLTDALIYTSTANRTRIFRARSVDVVDPSPEKPTVMLHNGTAYLLDHQGRDDNEQIYRNLQLHLNPLDQSPNVKRKAKSVTELARSAFPADHAELQWRQSRGLTALLMALLAISLSRVKPRQGRFSTLLPLTLLFVAIFYGGDVCRTLVANGAIPLIPGLWLVPGLMLMGLLMLVARDFSLLQKFSR